MTIQKINTSYQAKWESLPAALRPPVLTTAEKVGKAAWNLFSVLIPLIGLARLAAYGVGTLARPMLLPAAHRTTDLKEDCRKNFNGMCERAQDSCEITQHTVATPDGAKLSVHLFRHRAGDAATPTTIYFQGNGALKGMNSWVWMIDQANEKESPMNFVVFDYRSVDESTGKFTESKDLLVDGSSVVDWVRKEVKTPSHRINLYGLSLGGAIAVKTGALNEIGWVVNERSFSNLKNWVKTHIENANQQMDRAEPKTLLGRCLRWVGKGLLKISHLAPAILHSQALELDAAADFPKIKGRKLVVYHDQDKVIPYGASLAKQFPEGAVQLIGNALDNHNSRLADYPGAQERIAGFMFARA